MIRGCALLLGAAFAVAAAAGDGSYLSEAWKLGPADAGVRRLVDVVEYRPLYAFLHHTSSPNGEPSSPAPGREATENWDATELLFQVSFKTELISRQAFDDLGVGRALRPLGIDNARLWFGYTQKAAWQVFSEADSRQIRETNYEPEAILTFGTTSAGDGFKLLNLGLVHQSNGLQQSEHRGWNRGYVQGGWEWQGLSLLARVWHRFPVAQDDNPDIENYLGHGDVEARCQTPAGYVARALVRANVRTGKGYAQLDWATPPLRSLGTLAFHVQLTRGYGETLIDYNHAQTTFGAGFSFAD